MVSGRYKITPHLEELAMASLPVTCHCPGSFFLQMAFSECD